MEPILDGLGGDAGNDDGDAGTSPQPIGATNPDSGNSAVHNNEPEWTSFRGDGDSGSGFSDPDATTASARSGSDADAPFGRFANGKPRKRPARGAKSAPGSTRRDPAKESIPLASLLFSSHFMASKFLVPELELSEDESKTMARAITEVSQYYEIPMVSPQQVAWYNLVTTAAMIYGTRFVAYRNRSRREAAESRAQNVAPISSRNFGAM